MHTYITHITIAQLANFLDLALPKIQHLILYKEYKELQGHIRISEKYKESLVEK